MKNNTLTFLFGILLFTACGKEYDATGYVGTYAVEIIAPYEFSYYRTVRSRLEYKDTMTIQLAEDNYSVIATGNILSGTGAMNDEHELIFQPMSDTLRTRVSVGLVEGLTLSGTVKIALAHPTIALQADSTYYEAPMTGSIYGSTSDWDGIEYGNAGAEISGTSRITIRRL